jgi:hypothetical protein
VPVRRPPSLEMRGPFVLRLPLASHLIGRFVLPQPDIDQSVVRIGCERCVKREPDLKCEQGPPPR